MNMTVLIRVTYSKVCFTAFHIEGNSSYIVFVRLKSLVQAVQNTLWIEFSFFRKFQHVTCLQTVNHLDPFAFVTIQPNVTFN